MNLLHYREYLPHKLCKPENRQARRRRHICIVFLLVSVSMRYYNYLDNMNNEGCLGSMHQTTYFLSGEHSSSVRSCDRLLIYHFCLHLVCCDGIQNTLPPTYWSRSASITVTTPVIHTEHTTVFPMNPQNPIKTPLNIHRTVINVLHIIPYVCYSFSFVCYTQIIGLYCLPI